MGEAKNIYFTCLKNSYDIHFDIATRDIRHWMKPFSLNLDDPTTMLEKTPAEEEEELRVQLMPFDLEYDGAAPVRDFFESSVRKVDSRGKVMDSGVKRETISDATKKEDERENGSLAGETNHYLTASFRGRLLHGKRYALPEGYQGIVSSDEAVQEGAFSSFLSWNLDKKPSWEDAIDQVLSTWVHVAQGLHKPLPVTEPSMK